MEMVQEFAIAGKSPFSNRQLADMGVAKNLATQEFTHAYRMWNIIEADDRTRVRFKSHLQEAYLNREELGQTAGDEGYGIYNNVKHVKTEYAFMNFASATAVCDADFTELTTMNGNLSTKLRQQEDYIWGPQSRVV